jgi:hypothetical protein
LTVGILRWRESSQIRSCETPTISAASAAVKSGETGGIAVVLSSVIAIPLSVGFGGAIWATSTSIAALSSDSTFRRGLSFNRAAAQRCLGVGCARWVRPQLRLPCSAVTATLHIHYRPGEDDERLTRLAAALDELAAALGLDRPPPADIGGNYSFYGMSASELRGKLAAVQADTGDLFHVTDDGD